MRKFFAMLWYEMQVMRIVKAINLQIQYAAVDLDKMDKAVYQVSRYLLDNNVDRENLKVRFFKSYQDTYTIKEFKATYFGTTSCPANPTMIFARGLYNTPRDVIVRCGRESIEAFFLDNYIVKEGHVWVIG